MEFKTWYQPGPKIGGVGRVGGAQHDGAAKVEEMLKTRGALLMKRGGRRRKTDEVVGAVGCAGGASGCRRRCFNISPSKVKTLGSTSENESMQTGAGFPPLAAHTGQMR